VGSEEVARSAGEIIQQVRRMKGVLHGLAASELSAEVLREARPWKADELLLRLADLEPGTTTEVTADGVSTQPLAIVEQITRELLKNAQQVAPLPVALAIELGRDKLIVRVEDEGPGIEPGELSLVLSPFYSKRGGTGLGLFLASVHARQLGGELNLQSRVGRGTRATLSLPARLGEQRPEAPGAPPGRVSS
jgi:signal transduction histidine kinase